VFVAVACSVLFLIVVVACSVLVQFVGVTLNLFGPGAKHLHGCFACLQDSVIAWHGMLDMLSVSMCLPAGLLSSIPDTALNAYLLACSDACFQGYVACRSVCASRLCLVKDDFLCLLALLVTKTICLRLFKEFQSFNIE
jgi:hypothetical protein